VDIFPAIAAGAPGALAPLVASSLAFTTVIALGLNLLFRIGVKKTVTLKLERDAVGGANISDFLRMNGAKTEGIFRVPGDLDEVNNLKVILVFSKSTNASMNSDCYI
jgi:hypothetical protein